MKPFKPDPLIYKEELKKAKEELMFDEGDFFADIEIGGNDTDDIELLPFAHPQVFYETFIHVSNVMHARDEMKRCEVALAAIQDEQKAILEELKEMQKDQKEILEDIQSSEKESDFAQ